MKDRNVIHITTGDVADVVNGAFGQNPLIEVILEEMDLLRVVEAVMESEQLWECLASMIIEQFRACATQYLKEPLA